MNINLANIKRQKQKYQISINLLNHQANEAKAFNKSHLYFSQIILARDLYARSCAHIITNWNLKSLIRDQQKVQ